MDTEAQEIQPVEQVGVNGIGEEPGSLPGGTVTFLFTDIEGSTRLLEKLREGYAQVLAEQRQILREVFQRWHGHEVDTQGDSFFVAFGRATDAIACAMEAQRRLAEHAWPQGVNVWVRMGLHTGEPLVAATGYVGIDVHRAARIGAVGHGGQVLLSQTTRDLVYMDLPELTGLRDLGSYKLKDIRFPQQIYQLEIEGLPAEFPPLKTLSAEEEPPTPGEPPYMGLQYFDEGDAEWFFGRQAVTYRLVEAAIANRFLAVVGASGSGKSSVVRAGLVPAMKARSSPRWQVRIMTPTSHPLEALAVCLTQEAESVTATATLIDDMQGSLRSLHLFCQKKLAGRKEARLLLVVDQFEELFTACRSEEERLAFVTNLLYAACVSDGKVTVVITLRADFYDRLAQYVGLREMVAAHQVYIGSMRAAELRSAIEEPAARGGWEFSPGLVDLVLSDLGAGEGREPEPGALPLLSHALLETWKRRRGNLMSLKAYFEAGGVRGAIAKTAESVFYGRLTPEQQVIAKDIFLRLTELGEGAQDTRRRISIHELIPPGPAIEAEQVRAVLGVLADARLITTAEKTVEVAHEALIREWPTLREWLAADREGLRLHRQLTEAAQEWELLERDAGALYRGARLSQALEWAMAHPRSLSAMEQDFLEASRGAAGQEQVEREAQRQRELEAAQKLAEERGRSAQRLRRRAYWLGGVLVLALVLAALAGMFGQQSASNAQLANQNYATAEAERLRAEGEANQRATAEASAQDAANLATSRFLTAAALSNLELDSQLSAHLALLAFQAYPTYEAESALHMVLPRLRQVNSIPNASQFWSLPSSFWLLKDGKLLVRIIPNAIEVVDYASGTRSTFAQGKECVGIRPTRDGNFLLATFKLSEVQTETQVWEIETQKLLFTFPESTSFVWDGIIPPSPTYPLLAYRSFENLENHTMDTRIWEVPSGKERFLLSAHSLTPELTVSYVDLAASRDGKFLASFGLDGQVIFWDAQTGDKLLQFDDQSAGLGNAEFSPDGNHLATWGWDQTIKIWNLTVLSPGPRLEHIIHQVQSNNSYFMYSPDGTHLATGADDGLIRLWDTQTGELAITLSGHKGTAVPLAFSQDGTQLYTASSDKSIIEWDLTPGRELLTLTGTMGSASFSPDGTRLALIKADGTIAILNSQTGKMLYQWKAHSEFITDLAWSPDGKRMVTTFWLAGTQIGAQKIWDAFTGKLLKELPKISETGVITAIWSPDSSRLMTIDQGGNYGSGAILIWNVDSGEVVQKLPVQPTGHFAAAYSPDGSRIATSAQRELFVRDASTGTPVFTYQSDHTPRTLAFSPDGRRLASNTLGNILLFKITERGGELERQLDGGDGWINSIDFSPDGGLLAAGDSTGTVRVWDLRSMQLRFELSTFPNPVVKVAFSPDGRRLVASNEWIGNSQFLTGGMTYFYVLPPEELIQLVRSHITRPLETAECLKYLGTETCPPWP